MIYQSTSNQYMINCDKRWSCGGSLNKDKLPVLVGKLTARANRLLFFMAAEFIVTSTPMSLVKILTVCGVDTEQQAFKVDPHIKNIGNRNTAFFTYSRISKRFALFWKFSLLPQISTFSAGAMTL